MICADKLIAFWLFAIVAAATPGPNNLMVVAGAARAGFARTQALILGIATGVFLLVMAVGFGLGALFEALPWLYQTMQLLGAAYLLYLAWRIANAGVIKRSAAQDSGLGFIHGASFQLINPKAWMIAVSIVSTYAPKTQYLANVALLALVFCLTAIITLSIWAGFGTALQHFLRKPATARWFNALMGLCLALAVLPILFD